MKAEKAEKGTERCGEAANTLIKAWMRWSSKKVMPTAEWSLHTGDNWLWEAWSEDFLHGGPASAGPQSGCLLGSWNSKKSKEAGILKETQRGRSGFGKRDLVHVGPCRPLLGVCILSWVLWGEQLWDLTDAETSLSLLRGELAMERHGRKMAAIVLMDSEC